MTKSFSHDDPIRKANEADDVNEDEEYEDEESGE